MQVNKVQSNPNPRFGALIVDKSAAPILKKMSAKELKQIREWQKEFANTKHWDLKLEPYFPHEDCLLTRLVNKNEAFGVQKYIDNTCSWDCNGNSVVANSFSSYPQEVNPSKYTLRFPTSMQAVEAYNLMKNQWYSSVFKKVERSVNLLKVHEKAFEHMSQNR